jgi:prephenate dehydrogenase
VTFGVIGYGSFGEFLTGVLVKYGNVRVYSKRNISSSLPKGAQQTAMEEVASSQIVIIATGLSELSKVCEQIAKHVSSQTVVLDVCSVKTKPVEIMKQHLSGKCQLLATHPLFGPQTAPENNIKGKKIVIYPIEVSNLNQIISLLRDVLGLEVIEMEPTRHDREMAWVHALTFFVGRSLMELNLPKSDLTTDYYQKLLDLVELEKTHSAELFETVELGNPFAADVRQQFIKVIDGVESKLEGSK